MSDLDNIANHSARRMRAVMEGRASLNSLDAAERSAIRYQIYRTALDVLNAGDKEARRARLAQVPETVRESVSQEAIRIWEYRKQHHQQDTRKQQQNIRKQQQAGQNFA